VTARDTLLASVLDDPSDDTARLVLADHLRDSDHPDERARRQVFSGQPESEKMQPP
jgi:uncharacterized protein (TIGR02996 family)